VTCRSRTRGPPSRPERGALTTAPDTDGHREWVEAWRAAVRASPLAVSLIDLTTNRLLELSPRGAELLGTTRDEGVGVDCLTFAEDPQESARTIQLVREGTLDAIRIRRRVVRSDGSVIEVKAAARAIRSGTGADLELLVADEVVYETEHATATDDGAEAPAQPAAPELDGDRLAVGTLDARWRVAQINTYARQLLGWRPTELIGKSMIELTHPDDVAALLLTFALATTERTAEAHLRLRHRGGSWPTMRVVMTLRRAEGAPRFGFALTRLDESGAASSVRIDQLEHHLRRIATEIHAADVSGASGGPLDLALLPALHELSARQWEVVSRLVRGERVPTIAAEMYLSQSTVRNHLASVFRQVGVHSQQELVALLLRHVADPSTAGDGRPAPLGGGSGI
jgi:PAS domain S-box-containing protein